MAGPMPTAAPAAPTMTPGMAGEGYPDASDVMGAEDQAMAAADASIESPIIGALSVLQQLVATQEAQGNPQAQMMKQGLLQFAEALQQSTGAGTGAPQPEPGAMPPPAPGAGEMPPPPVPPQGDGGPIPPPTGEMGAPQPAFDPFQAPAEGRPMPRKKRRGAARPMAEDEEAAQVLI